MGRLLRSSLLVNRVALFVSSPFGQPRHSRAVLWERVRTQEPAQTAELRKEVNRPRFNVTSSRSFRASGRLVRFPARVRQMHTRALGAAVPVQRIAERPQSLMQTRGAPVIFLCPARENAAAPSSPVQNAARRRDNQAAVSLDKFFASSYFFALEPIRYPRTYWQGKPVRAQGSHVPCTPPCRGHRD